MFLAVEKSHKCHPSGKAKKWFIEIRETVYFLFSKNLNSFGIMLSSNQNCDVN